MNIRFIEDEIQVLYYGNYKSININNKNARWVNAKYDEDEDLQKKYTHIFLVNDPDWNPLDEIEVFVNGESKGTISKTYESHKTLVACTLLAKWDIPLIPAWVEYHKKRGVEHFYLYINDRIDSCVLPKIEGVTYTEWPLIYWLNDVAGTVHCAQILAITDFLYFAKHFCEYILFCDLDEFIENPVDLSGRKLCYAFMNKHVYLNNSVSFLKTSEPIENREFTENPRDWLYKDGSKCIVSTKIEVMNIHYVQNPPADESNMEISGRFFHVRNFKNRINSGDHVQYSWRTGHHVPLRFML